MSAHHEQLERLIVRELDGEITAAEREDLGRAMSADASLRERFDEYRQIDVQAREALRSVCVSAPAVAANGRPRRGLWLAAAAGVLAAAAAVAFLVLPRDAVQPPTSPQPDPFAADARLFPNPAGPAVVQPWMLIEPGGTARALPDASATQWVDYVPQPPVHARDLRRRATRNWIGVSNQKGDEILLLEWNRRETKIVPVAGDY